MKRFSFRCLLFLGLFTFLVPSIAHTADIIPSNRKVNWNPGVPGGIPNRTTIYANVKTDYGARGNGSADDTSAIQNAINACPTGQVVYMPEGDYRVTREITITKGIVLRGAGPDKTKIKADTSSTNIIFIGVRQGSSAITSVRSGYTKGSNSITVNSGSNFNVGDYITIDQRNDSSLVSKGDCTWFNRNNGDRAIGQIVKIIAKSSNTLTIDPGLYYEFSANFSPEIIKVANTRVEYAGVEDLYVERVTSRGQNNIQIMRGAYCWLKNVETNRTQERHIHLSSCFRCEVRDSYVHHSYAYSGGKGYGISLSNQTSDTLIENNILYYLRHGLILEGAGAGNVIGYNYSERYYAADVPNTTFLMADFSGHCVHPIMNLFEGNIGNHIGQDYTHGSASHNTYFRNHIDGDSYGQTRSHRIPVDIHKYNYYMNIVGNILGRPGDTGSYELENANCSGGTRATYKLGYTSDGDCSSSGNDSKVKATLLRHGNFDYISNSTRWDSNISDRNLPESYYLTAKPAFFGCRSWPAIGPDLSPMIGSLPAKNRFDSINPCTGGDTTPPTASGHNPAKGAANIATDTSIVVHVKDGDDGVNQSTIVMTVEGSQVVPTITGTSADYTLTYNSPADFENGQAVNVTVNAADLAGNAMRQDAYSFTIMLSLDTTAPVVNITSPTSSSTYATTSAVVNIAGTASDDVEVAGIEWSNDRGGSGTASGTSSWSVANITVYEGDNLITVSATDTSGNSSTDSLTVTYTIPAGTFIEEFGDAANTNYPGTCLDTYINHGNYSEINASTEAYLNTYTTPTDNSANRVLMQWNLSAIPSSATVQSATLSLNLGAMYGDGGDAGYEISVHEIINNNPEVNTCNWNTYDGTNSWSGGANGAVQDMVTAEDSQVIDKTTNEYKSWTITNMVAAWVADPSQNFGMILESDNTAASDSNRRFFSSDHTNSSQRPKLVVTYTVEDNGNDSPVITPTVPNIVTNEDTSTTLDLTTYETDAQDSGTALDWSISGVNTSLFSAQIDADSDVLTINPVANANGSDTVTLTLTDSGELTDTQDITVVINAVPDSPVITPTVPNIIITEYTATTLDLTTYETDAQDSGTALGWSISGVNTSLFSAQIDADSDVLTINPVANGSDTVTLTLTNSSGLTDTQDITVTCTIPLGGTTFIKEFGDAANTNYPGTCLDTYINHGNYSEINASTEAYLNTYTTPTDNSANRVIMQWDLSAIPSSATVQSATLSLNLGAMYGNGGDAGYEISVHEIINNNPEINTCNWNTYDGTNSWSGGANGAVQDMVTAEDSQVIDKTTNEYKSWTVTNMVAAWVADPSQNFGMILESDNTAASDSNRRFFSSEHSDSSQRPKLVVTYTVTCSCNDSPVIVQALPNITTDEDTSTTFVDLSANETEAASDVSVTNPDTVTSTLADSGGLRVNIAGTSDTDNVSLNDAWELDNSEVFSAFSSYAYSPDDYNAFDSATRLLKVNITLEVNVIDSNGEEIVAWLLSDDDQATVPLFSDPRWIETKPNSYKLALPLEGTKVIYLWLKDALNNVIVAPINDSIILRPLRQGDAADF